MKESGIPLLLDNPVPLFTHKKIPKKTQKAILAESQKMDDEELVKWQRWQMEEDEIKEEMRKGKPDFTSIIREMIYSEFEKRHH